MTDMGQTRTGRDAPVSWRPPKHLRAEFFDRVNRSGLSAGAFITKAVFGIDPPRQSRRPPVEKAELAKLLAACAAIRDELKRHERGGDDASHSALREAAQALQDMRASIFKLMGRTP